MSADWSGTVAALCATPSAEILGVLAVAVQRGFRTSEAQQLRAWTATIDLLRAALAPLPAAAAWHIALEFPMLRLGKRPDVIILAGHAIFVIEMKAGATTFARADRAQVDDYAIDLHDFHAGSRANPIIPILLAEHATPAAATMPLLLSFGVAETLDANATTLGALLAALDAAAARVAPPLDPAAWHAAAYRPVPTIVDAARLLYARHDVAEIRAARTDAHNLAATTDAIRAEIDQARADHARLILFVTGIPGAGKTLCGLNAIFGATGHERNAYLTGNPTLVHVLRAALTRDAIAAGATRSAARRKMASAIQALPKFRDHYVQHHAEPPDEHIVVIDEAQRSWSAAQAVAKSRDKPIPLSRSEPAHLLEIMSRQAGFCALICLIGGGQEIHTGEAGIAEWGHALRDAADHGSPWRVRAPPDLGASDDRRQRLGDHADLRIVDPLHLDVPIRQIRSHLAAPWVDRVLAGDAAEAAAIAARAGTLPFVLTRDADTMRRWLWAEARGLRRAGLLASSGAARLRAEGLGVELPHQDEDAVARWFLDRFPDDPRASGALEQVATEFGCQGLELDYAGICWDIDLIPDPTQAAWQPRQFRGKDWQVVRKPEKVFNRLNAYRVLLTRARYETIIYVPRGSLADRTRPPALYDAIVDFLSACGVGAAGRDSEAVLF